MSPEFYSCVLSPAFLRRRFTGTARTTAEDGGTEKLRPVGIRVMYPFLPVVCSILVANCKNMQIVRQINRAPNINLRNKPNQLICRDFFASFTIKLITVEPGRRSDKPAFKDKASCIKQSSAQRLRTFIISFI